MLHLNLYDADRNEQILPVEYSENYFHLMPGEEITVSIRWREEDGTSPLLRLDGFNVRPSFH